MRQIRKFNPFIPLPLSSPNPMPNLTTLVTSYEPDWENVFWGEKYERLLEIKKRIDPTNLFVCNRCVGTDIEYEP